jgi:hypothetical protein
MLLKEPLIFSAAVWEHCTENKRLFTTTWLAVYLHVLYITQQNRLFTCWHLAPFVIEKR